MQKEPIGRFELAAERFDAACALLAAGVAWLLFYAGAALAVGLIGWQCYVYLRHGFWPPMSVVDALFALGHQDGWIVAPQSWAGVHKILSAIPASLVALAVCWLLAAIAKGISITMRD